MACLYRHIRKDINVPFYIGIGKDISRAYSKSHRNNHWNNIVSISGYDVDIIFEDIDYDFAKEKEKEFISIYKRRIDGGTLCNITLGGDGVLGIRHTKESKIKMGLPNKGKIISDNHKRIISEFHKGKSVPRHVRDKMSASSIGCMNSMYGKSPSAETLNKMRSSAKRGELNHASKLNKEDIINIRADYDNGASQRFLANKFGVSKTNISCIVKRITWDHI